MCKADCFVYVNVDFSEFGEQKVAKLVSGKRIAHLWYNSSFKNWQLLRTVRTEKVMKIFILAFLAVIAVSSSEGKPKFEFYLSTSDESEPSWLEPELELKDFQLGSARDLFPFSSKSKIGRKRAEID